jgi:acetoin utilization protein AcuB
MLVKDWMMREPAYVTPEDSLLHAKQIMKRHGVRHLPVVRDGRVEGILTDRDVRDYTPSHCRSMDVFELGQVIDRLTVDEVMTRQPITVAPQMPVARAARLMLDNGFNGLPVVEHGRLVGIFTTSDALRVLAGGVCGKHTTGRETVTEGAAR